MSEINKDLEAKNRDKYGEKQFDVIADSYRVGKKEGDIYCGFNAIKYIKRYVGKSHKAQNPIDLDKAIDYLTRMKEQIPPDAKATEVVEK